MPRLDRGAHEEVAKRMQAPFPVPRGKTGLCMGAFGPDILARGRPIRRSSQPWRASDHVGFRHPYSRGAAGALHSASLKSECLKLLPIEAMNSVMIWNRLEPTGESKGF